MTSRFCTICTSEITDNRRLARSSPYCSDGCRRVAKNEARDAQAGKKCRLCRRAFRAVSNLEYTLGLLVCGFGMGATFTLFWVMMYNRWITGAQPDGEREAI